MIQRVLKKKLLSSIATDYLALNHLHSLIIKITLLEIKSFKKILVLAVKIKQTHILYKKDLKQANLPW